MKLYKYLTEVVGVDSLTGLPVLRVFVWAMNIVIVTCLIYVFSMFVLLFSMVAEAHSVAITSGVPLTELNYQTTRDLFNTDEEFISYIKTL